MPEPSLLDQACEITEKLSQKPQAHDDEAEDEKSSTTGNFNASVQVQCSGAPIGQTDVYDFDSFIQRMRHPSCKPILENIKRFLQVYLEKLKSVREDQLDEMIEAYRSFYSVIKVKLLQTAVWQGEDVTDQERANAMEGLESLLLNQLHDRVLGITRAEREADNVLEEKMVLHGGWIQLEHLDFPVEKLGTDGGEEARNEWLYAAINEFQKISAYRTPRDKLVCNLNGCKILHSVIQDKMSADDFLPLLIYCLIRANPSRLQSNINYITRFRAPEKITGEVAYFFTHTMAAVEFIQKMDAEALSMESATYDLFVREAHEQLLKQEELLRPDSPDPLDEAEAKAEELFMKAKEAFHRTGQKASAALKDLKESDLARRSMDQIGKFVKELTSLRTLESTTGGGSDEEFAKASSMSIMEQPLVEPEENKVDEVDSGAGISQ